MATRTRGPYAKTRRIRQQAIEAAIEIFGVSGYNGATLTDVADKLGMSLPGLQHHFPDKDTLLAAVLEERDRQAEERVNAEAGIDATAQLLEIVVTNEQHPGLVELHCVLSAEATSPQHPAHAYFIKRYAFERAEGERYFSEQMRQGLIGDAVPAASLASQLIALVDGLQLQWLLDRTAVDLRAEVQRFLEVAVPAMAGAAVPAAV